MIEGMLDISLPLDYDENTSGREEREKMATSKPRSSAPTPGAKGNKPWGIWRNSAGYSDPMSSKNPSGARRYLFTVNPGGIAGYLGLSFPYASLISG